MAHFGICKHHMGSLFVSNTNIKKLETIQNTVLQITTSCTRDTITQHLHNKTKVLPMDTHLKHHATTITSQLLSSRKNNKVTNTTPYYIHSSEQTLPRHMRTKLASLRANKSPLLKSCLHTVNPETYMPQCLLCLSHTHDTNHFFNCCQVPTQNNTTSL